MVRPERERCPLGGGVVADGGVEPAPGLVLEPRFLDVELEGVQDDRVGGRLHVEHDRLEAGEGRGVEIGFQRQVVPGRYDRARQAVLVGKGHPSRIPVLSTSGWGAVPASG